MSTRIVTATGAVAAVALAVALALTGCATTGAQTTTPSGTPASTAATSGHPGATSSTAAGFPQDAVIGVVLLHSARTPDTTSGGVPLATRFQDDLTAAGFRPDVRVAGASDPAADQDRDVRALVDAGARVVLVDAADPAALEASVRTAHDRGVSGVALGDPVAGADGGRGSGVSPDLRVQGGTSDAATVAHATAVVEALQRGERPTVG